VSILASFRGWNDFACSDRRAGCDVAMEGNERRFYLHPRAIRCLDNSFASSNRRENSAPKRAHEHVSAAPCVLPSRECSDLDGDS
jgi:hypothetical protein